MAAYVIASIDVDNPAGYEEYRRLVPATVQQYGGRFLVRGGRLEVMEGTWRPRCIIIEFESFARAKQWYDSPEYAKAKPIRLAAAKGDLVIVEGT